MFDPKEKDFAAIEAWGLKEDPLRAIHDFSPAQMEMRWRNPWQQEADRVYHKKREDYIARKNFDHYYKTAEKPIDQRRWEYLKDRKAWYIPPLEWERFAAKDVRRIADLGCGDGDVTQRMADYIAQCWKKQGYAGHAVEIYGYDLNPSRIVNAKAHCRSPHPDIRFHFDVCDVIGGNIPHPDRFFDYTVATGVFEILEDAPADKFMAEFCRVAAKGVYIEDLADQYPGGYPRDDFENWFGKYGFQLTRKHPVTTQPFTPEGCSDPMELWPILKVWVLFAEAKVNGQAHRQY